MDRANVPIALGVQHLDAAAVAGEMSQLALDILNPSDVRLPHGRARVGSDSSRDGVGVADKCAEAPQGVMGRHAQLQMQSPDHGFIVRRTSTAGALYGLGRGRRRLDRLPDLARRAAQRRRHRRVRISACSRGYATISAHTAAGRLGDRRRRNGTKRVCVADSLPHRGCGARDARQPGSRARQQVRPPAQAGRERRARCAGPGDRRIGPRGACARSGGGVNAAGRSG